MLYNWLIKLAILKHIYLNNSLSFQLLNDDSRFQIYVLRASELGLISSTWLDRRKDIQSVKPARLSCIQSKLKACILPLSKEIIKDAK